MCLRKAVQIALFLAIAAIVVAEPPSAYGPPGFASGFRSNGFAGFSGGHQTAFQGTYQSGFQGGYQGGFQGGYQGHQGGYQGHQGGYQGHQGGYQGYSNGGYSDGRRGGYRGGYQDNYDNAAPQPFSFQYEVKDSQSGNDFGHHATSDGRQVTGEYHVLLPDGRRQIVKYVADDNGYNADVQYEGQARVPQSTGYGGYRGYQDNQYHDQGYQGNFGGYRGDFGGHKGGFTGYRY